MFQVYVYCHVFSKFMSNILTWKFSPPIPNIKIIHCRVIKWECKRALLHCYGCLIWHNIKLKVWTTASLILKISTSMAHSIIIFISFFVFPVFEQKQRWALIVSLSIHRIHKKIFKLCFNFITKINICKYILKICLSNFY